ncbi:MAG: hypothetical protein JWM06_1672 [Actinomycetia bacterium]|nr:hypothetical protein [Actinomycetes bacterium]
MLLALGYLSWVTTIATEPRPAAAVPRFTLTPEEAAARSVFRATSSTHT